MKKSTRYPVAIIVGLLIVSPAFAQTSPTPKQNHQEPKKSRSTSATTQQQSQGIGANKQRTDAGITEIGPGSKAYFGNTEHSKY